MRSSQRTQKNLSPTTRLRRPASGPLFRIFTAELSLNSHPLFIPEPKKEPAFKLKHQDDVFAAIRLGDVNSIIDWLDTRPFCSRAYDEAALDFALINGQYAIADLYRDDLSVRETEREEMVAQQYELSNIDNRVTRDFNAGYMFKTVFFEMETNGTAQLFISFRTPLVAPYFEPLKQLGGNHYTDRITFNFSLANEEFDQLYFRFFQILEFLSPKAISLFREFFEALEVFYMDSCQGYSASNYFIRTEVPLSSHHITNTYDDYQIYKAAKNFDYNAIDMLLKNNANPNAMFDKETMLYTVVTHGLNNALDTNQKPKHAENCKEILNIVDLLLQYGADPTTLLPEHNSTLAECLIRSILNTKNNQEIHVKQEVIKRLGAAKAIGDSVMVHRSLAQLPLVESIKKMNDILKRRKNQSSFIRNLVTVNRPTAKYIYITTRDGKQLQIETKKRIHLSKEKKEEEQLYALYEPIYKLLRNADPKAYWDALLQANGGEIYFDIVRENDKVIGFVITEINENAIVDGKESTVYYSKMSLGKLPQYPGLMRLIANSKNFAQYDDKKPSYMFYEVVSARAYSMGTNIKQFPDFFAPKSIIESLIKNVYPLKDLSEVIEDNGVWYVKDDLTVKDEAETSNNYVNQSVFYQKKYSKAYRKEGHALIICYENNDENKTRFIESLASLLGKENILKTFELYQSNKITFQAKY